MDKPQIILHVEKTLNYTPFDVKWMPKSAKVLAFGSHHKGSGALQLYELSDGDLKLIKDIERPKALKCGTFGASKLEDRHVAFGDFDGNLELFDITHKDTPIFTIKAHTKIINAIDGVAGLNIGKGEAHVAVTGYKLSPDESPINFFLGAPELVTGSRDGTVKIWDPRQKEKPVVSIEPAEEEEKRDCWGVAFGNAHSLEERCVCAGFDNGDVKLFDLRTNSVRWETNLNNGICCLQFDRKDIEMNKLVVTTLEGRFSVFDLRTFHEKEGYASVGQKVTKSSTVWCVRHLPQNRDIFLTSGGNGSLNLWKYSYPSKRTEKLKDGTTRGVAGEVLALNDRILSSQPITNLDWSPDKTGLCAGVSIDQTLKIVIFTKLNTL